MSANGQTEARQPILVPLDGSELAERALRYVALIPSQTVRLLACAPITLSAARGRWALDEVPPNGGTWMVSSPADYLDLVCFPLRAQGRDVDVVVAAGKSGPCIVGASADADLIVMMTRGHGATRLLVGSTSAHVVRHAAVPTLVIRDERRTAHPLARLVVPLDGSENAEEALPVARILSQRLGAALHLVRVVDLGSWTASTNDLERDTATYLERQVARLIDHAGLVTHEVLVPTAGMISEQILSILRPSDLVVMATQGHGGLKRRLLGSVSTSVLERATVPVVLIRATPGKMERAVAGLAERSESVG
ncbi:MAG: universal stress protein [Thermomicrobiales bacterium]